MQLHVNHINDRLSKIVDQSGTEHGILFQSHMPNTVLIDGAYECHTGLVLAWCSAAYGRVSDYFQDKEACMFEAFDYLSYRQHEGTGDEF